MKLRNHSLKVAAALMLSSGVAFAATDGTLGLSSTGTTDITVTKGDLAQITDMDDFNLGPWTAGNLVQTDTVCVFTTTGLYNVTADSANGAGTFQVNSGANNIVYRVRWDDGATGLTTLTDATLFDNGGAGLAGSTTSACGGVNNATLEIFLSNANMTAAPVGVYTDVLSVTVAAQ
ncbi:MAG: hypothetical protein AAF512_14550 [Pseudomonadota bacterium]